MYVQRDFASDTVHLPTYWLCRDLSIIYPNIQQTELRFLELDLEQMTILRGRVRDHHWPKV